MRVAISQPEMHWSVDDHLGQVEVSLREASGRGAELVLFPELMLTGLHTKVPQLLDRVTLEDALATVAAACRRHHVSAAVGSPAWAASERPHDAVIVFDSSGAEILRSPKVRLMPPGEPLVFDAGTERPLLRHAGTTLAVVICREILDREELSRELARRAQNILWPGVMARGPLDTGNPEDYTLHASQLAQEQQSWIFHSNWANNVQTPGIPNTGKSMVVSPNGSVILEAPAQLPGTLLAWESSIDRAWIPAGASAV